MISNGIDLVLISRFDKFLNNDKFLNRYFTDAEINFINGKVETLAGLFAAKEAFLKSLSLGLEGANFKDIEIAHKELGAPYIILYNQIKKDTENYIFSVSISHDGDYAVASVVAFKSSLD